ncbi:hypothetical protein T4B_13763 [Trichinella pseudospiralis]|uniref:Uncharacterized protein n=1 Tax=Trichinella pseudospiralis TaxID=6337 RepID=A0A0V1EH65_TRIPS|nr:hypothetical protein T4A_5657 [Trichinella pseudospiralis]KRZ14956.1 hypothetical protein T4B_13763 [Trichinella pseudospiralis]
MPYNLLQKVEMLLEDHRSLRIAILQNSAERIPLKVLFINSENSNPWASWPMKKNYTIYEDEVKFGFLETSCLPNEDHIMMQGGLKQPEYTAVTMVIEVPVRKNLWKTCWSTAGRMTAGR